MSKHITDLSDFHFGNHMTRLGSSVIVDLSSMMVLSEADLQSKIQSELVFGVTKELKRAILSSEIPAEVLTEDTPMGYTKVEMVIAIIPKPMEMINDINEHLPVYGDDTLKKVYDILLERFSGDEIEASDTITELLNAGILFRERRA